MRKQESVHLHALLAEVATEFEERPGAGPPDLSSYRELGVRPSSVHCSKEDHERAVLELSSAIEYSFADQPTAGPR